MVDYSALDQPWILKSIFYPRRDYTPCPENAFDAHIAVDPGVSLGCRFFIGQPQGPWVLFFHGNGEVMSDYDGIAPFYRRRGINLAVAEYRGYGTSGGTPTLTCLVRDAFTVWEGVRKELSNRNFRSQPWVMGRSLGSVAALELARKSPGMIPGVIIESGCLSLVRVIRHVGIPLGRKIDGDAIDRECVKMVEAISVPALILHGAQDLLIPPNEAESLYRHLGSQKKDLVIIPFASHNTIMTSGLIRYFESLQQFIRNTDRPDRTASNV